MSAVAAGETGVRPLAGRRALVTGASGFIGSHLVTRLLAEGVEVHVLQRSDAPVTSARRPASGRTPVSPAVTALTCYPITCGVGIGRMNLPPRR